jgi:hypothetical protein
LPLNGAARRQKRRGREASPERESENSTAKKGAAKAGPYMKSGEGAALRYAQGEPFEARGKQKLARLKERSEFNCKKKGAAKVGPYMGWLALCAGESAFGGG